MQPVDSPPTLQVSSEPFVAMEIRRAVLIELICVRPTLTMNVDRERFSPKDSSFVFLCSTSESHLTISVQKIHQRLPITTKDSLCLSVSCTALHSNYNDVILL